MHITQVNLKNWRNFRTVDASLGLRAFVIGPNASGKSNFLDAFAFLKDIVKRGGGLQQAVTDRGGIGKIRCLAARQEPDVEIAIVISENSNTNNTWKYVIGITQQTFGNRLTLLTHEKVFYNDQLLLDRPNEKDKQDPILMTQTHIEQISANASFRPIETFFNSIQYQHLVPQLLKHPEAFTGKSLPGDPYGKNFLERVSRSPEPTRKSRLKKIEAALRIAVPQLKDLTDVKDETGVPHLEAVYQHWRRSGAKQREDQFSDGTLRLIGLLWTLLESDSLLLVEEPELSLNTGIIKQLPALMFQLQKEKKRQILISTHSYELLSDRSIAAEEVILLTPNEEGTTVQIASTLKDVKDLLEAGMSIGEAALPKTNPKDIRQLSLV